MPYLHLPLHGEQRCIYAHLSTVSSAVPMPTHVVSNAVPMPTHAVSNALLTILEFFTSTQQGLANGPMKTMEV